MWQSRLLNSSSTPLFLYHRHLSLGSRTVLRRTQSAALLEPLAEVERIYEADLFRYVFYGEGGVAQQLLGDHHSVLVYVFAGVVCSCSRNTFVR